MNLVRISAEAGGQTVIQQAGMRATSAVVRERSKGRDPSPRSRARGPARYLSRVNAVCFAKPSLEAGLFYEQEIEMIYEQDRSSPGAYRLRTPDQRLTQQY